MGTRNRKKRGNSSAYDKDGFFGFLTSNTSLNTFDHPLCFLNAHIFGHLPAYSNKIPDLRASTKYALQFRFTN
jgi:hypothetical protein